MAINASVWTITDTTSKLTQASGLLSCAGGLSSWGDPRIAKTVALTRSNGLTVVMEVTPAAGIKAEMGFSTALVALNTTLIGFLFESDSALKVMNYDGGSSPVSTPHTYTAATTILKIVFKTTGALWYFSLDSGTTWRIVWESVTGTTAPLYPAYLAYSGAFTSDYIRVSNGSVQAALVNVTPGAPVPSLGAEQILNPGFETAGGGGADIWASWNEEAGDGALANEATIKHGGSYAAKLTNGASDNTNVYCNNFAVADSSYQRLSLWTYGDGTHNSRYSLYDQTHATAIVNGASTAYSAAAWNQFQKVFRMPSGTVSIRIYVKPGQVNGSVAYIDDTSVKQITLASTLSATTDAGTKAGVFDINHGTLSLSTGEMRGGRICVSADGKYALHALTDGTSVLLVKRENDIETGTPLINTATGVTYAAGRKIRLVSVLSSGTTYNIGLYYESASDVFTKIGTTQSIDLASYGTLVQSFSTEASASDIVITVNGGM